MCLSNSKCHYALYKMYGILLSHAVPDWPFYVRDWELELGNNLAYEEWDKVFYLTFKITLSSYSLECNYKIMTRW